MGIETEDGNFIDISNISGDEAAALSTVQKKTKIKRAHKCEICKRSYGTEFQLQRHMQEHLKETACSNCSEVFNSSEDLDLHVVEKHAGKLYLCQECGLQFTTLSACSTHRLGTHFKSGKMPCPISSCKKIFSRSGRLEDHLNFHAGTKSHVCSICSKGFHTRDSVVKHEKSCGRLQPEVAAVVCICSECGKTYNNVTNLVDHMFHQQRKFIEEGTSMMSQEEIDILNQSPASSSSSADESAHSSMTPHSTDLHALARQALSQVALSTVAPTSTLKPRGKRGHLYMCGICGKEFNRKWNLTVHVRTHTGALPFKCLYCDRQFRHQNSLKLHMVRHTVPEDTKSYPCQVPMCGKNFVSAEFLLKHLDSAHSGMDDVTRSTMM